MYLLLSIADIKIPPPQMLARFNLYESKNTEPGIQTLQSEMGLIDDPDLFSETLVSSRFTFEFEYGRSHSCRPKGEHSGDLETAWSRPQRFLQAAGSDNVEDRQGARKSPSTITRSGYGKLSMTTPGIE